MNKQQSKAQLDKAIFQMKELLGEFNQNEDQQNINNVGDQNQEQDQTQIDSYVSVLDQRYQNILVLLEEEEQNLNDRKKQNQALKKQLGDVIQNARSYTLKKNQELQELEQIHNQTLNQKNVRDRESHYTQIEKKKLCDMIDIREKKIAENLEQILNTKSQNEAIQDPIKSFTEQINLSSGLLEQEIFRLQDLNSKYMDSQEINDGLKREYQNLWNRKKKLDGQINTYFGKEVSDDKENNRVKIQQSISLQKHSKAFKQYEQIYAIHEKLQEELAEKNYMLKDTRSFIQNFDSYSKNLEDTDMQTKYEMHRTVKLEAENEVLKKELEKYLYIQNRTGLYDNSNFDYSQLEDNKNNNEQQQYQDQDNQTNILQQQQERDDIPQIQSPPRQIQQDMSNLSPKSIQSVKNDNLNNSKMNLNKSYVSEVRKQFTQNPQNSQFITPEVQTEIQRLLDLHQSQSPQEIKTLEKKLIADNQIISLDVREIEQKIAGRMGILESQYDAIEKLQVENQYLNQDAQGLENEKRTVIMTQENIEAQMDMLNNKFSGIASSLQGSQMKDKSQVPYYKIDEDDIHVAGNVHLQQQQDNNNIEQILEITSKNRTLIEQSFSKNNNNQQQQQQLINQFKDQNLDDILNSQPSVLNIGKFSNRQAQNA